MCHALSSRARTHDAPQAERCFSTRGLAQPPATRVFARAAEIIILDGLVTVYRNSSDVWLYVVGTQNENECAP